VADDTGPSDDRSHRQLAIKIADRLDETDRKAVIAWAQNLLAIRAADVSVKKKAMLALRMTASEKVVWPVAKMIAAEVKRLVWDDRGIPARIGMGAAALGAVMLGGQSAGIAALGTAVGVPLWIVLGAGGAFAGVLIEELTKKRTPK
jgi:hypothetical protein